VQLADAEGVTAKGVVDARSRAFGVADPVTTRTQGAGAMQLLYTEVGLDWLEPEATVAENALELTLANVSAATLDVVRARLDPRSPLTVEATADAATSLVLAGAFPVGTTVTADGEPVEAVRAPDGSLTVAVAEGERSYLVTPPGSAAGAAPSLQPGAGAPQAPPADIQPPAATPVGQVSSARTQLPATGAEAVLPALALGVLATGAFLRARVRRRRPAQP
jgi:hypothetical protein